MDIVLTGITTSGTPHLGNYVGAIRPTVAASRDAGVQSFYFLADYHALVKNQDPERLRQSSLEVAATWLALGLDTDQAVFYRQSDIPEIPELTWVLSSVTAKGLMNRAHAYKAAVAENEEAGDRDPDKGITMGLFGSNGAVVSPTFIGARIEPKKPKPSYHRAAEMPSFSRKRQLLRATFTTNTGA